ncbi:MAG: hypothetical protein AAF960_05930 [Bacteroidota bacterium]
MYNFLAKNGQLVAFVGGILVTAGFLAGVFGGIEDFMATAEDQRNQSNIFNFGLYAVIALTVLGFVAALGFGLFQTISNPKAAIKGIAGIGLLVALYFIGQAVAGPDTQKILDTRQQFAVTDGQSAIINGSIIGGLILAGLTVVAFIGAEIVNFIKLSRK